MNDNDNERTAQVTSDERMMRRIKRWPIDKKTGRPSMAPIADAVWCSIVNKHPEVAIEVARVFLYPRSLGSADTRPRFGRSTPSRT